MYLDEYAKRKPLGRDELAALRLPVFAAPLEEPIPAERDNIIAAIEKEIGRI